MKEVHSFIDTRMEATERKFDLTIFFAVTFCQLYRSATYLLAHMWNMTPTIRYQCFSRCHKNTSHTQTDQLKCVHEGAAAASSVADYFAALDELDLFALPLPHADNEHGLRRRARTHEQRAETRQTPE